MAVHSRRDIAPGSGERTSWDDLLVPSRLRAAIVELNPDVPTSAVDDAVALVATAGSTDAIAENRAIHECLTEGLRKISYTDDTGVEVTPTIRLVSVDPDDNDWFVASQVTVIRSDYERRFDLVLYLNGMPIAVVELKNAGSEYASLNDAHAQLQTYLREFPLAFRYAVMALVSDGITASYGTPFTPFEHFSPWNVDDDGAPVEPSGDHHPLDTALFGIFNQERFLQLLRNYTAFDESESGLLKRIAKPHQYFAVSKAVGSTVVAVGSGGKAGVVWHTQGSGKSMEMELYANQVIRHPKLANPTIVVITDRNELDGQLYETFARSQLLPEQPKQIRRREELRQELSGRTTGGIYFTTLQKFGKSRRNVRPDSVTPSCRTAATSSWSWTKLIAVTTTTSTDTLGTCAMHSRTQPSLRSPERRSRSRTAILVRYSATTSTSTTLRARSTTAPPSQYISRFDS